MSILCHGNGKSGAYSAILLRTIREVHLLQKIQKITNEVTLPKRLGGRTMEQLKSRADRLDQLYEREVFIATINAIERVYGTLLPYCVAYGGK